MRLLMTTDTVGGVWTYSCDLAEGMLQRGWTVMLVMVGRAPSRSQAVWIAATTDRWPRNFTTRRVDVALEWMEDGDRCYKQSAAQMLAIAEKFAPEIVHCNQFCYGALPLNAVKVVVAHSDVLSWWEARYGERMPESAWQTRYCEQVQRGLAAADVVVAPTATAMSGLQREFDLRAEARVIANGRTTWSAELSDAEVFAAKRMQVMTCGRVWDEGKNVRLLEVARPTLPVLIAGERALMADAHETVATELAAEGDSATRYTGTVSADVLERLMLESAIYVVTSRYEPFGLAAVEAALAGCAVVANDIESLREVWGDAAVFFAKGDAGSLGRLLGELAEDPERVRQTARACRSRALACFSAERMAEAYAGMYERLLRERAVRAERGVHVA